MGHTRYSGYRLSDDITDIFACSLSNKVVKMSNFGSKDCFESQEQGMSPVNENLAGNEDLIMEQILENINTTPIGMVLKKIASLPEVRKEKVLHVRQQLTEGEYDLNERLDVALDKVLEDLTT
ncbi:MAG TPA: flagellar biosynthesis anti-sigma factor FlgM [Phycisphaerales bacterium]|nr:flagellar biosynthesis anti-sigma factor FlgM [Phycisphaerales bacterium]